MVFIEPIEKGVGLGKDRRFGLSWPTGKRAVRHRQPRITRKSVFFPEQKSPVEIVEGTRVPAGLLLNIVGEA